MVPKPILFCTLPGSHNTISPSPSPRTSACKELPHPGCCSTLQSKLGQQIVAEQTAAEQGQQTAEEQIAAGQIAAAGQGEQIAEEQQEQQIAEEQRWAFPC